VAPAILPKLAEALTKENVKLRGTKEVMDILQDVKGDLETITDDDFDNEYLSLTVGVKLVDSVDDAISHINTHGSHHTDSIITDDADTAERFMQMVDSAGVYHNCSTRFSDGFRYGFGAEVGISTGKIHARGPVGLEGLVTYKYRLYGHGQTVGEYASGEKSFHHRDL
ncbi:MAG: gamma-glutamyl-phosphate reductase, partial [Eubacterium sp.]|nr:gamma-glutamyl-phosphate reductase [Eubacterium sp.]